MIHRNVIVGLAMLGLIGVAQSTVAEENAEKPKIDCLTCHDASVSHPISAMMMSKHWDESNDKTPVSNDGCQSCHGMSQDHANTPTRIQPTVSFGPRWTTSVDAQNDTCLTCHEKTATHNQWREGIHAANEVTCVTCHEVHVEVDKVRIAETQAEVCTVCHKIQKTGIHHMEERRKDNPKCASCHNPHANPSPTVMMLANRSEGCRTCHDFQKMEQDPTVSAKSKSYHRVMQNDDRTCVDCHRGVAHVDKSNFGQVLAGGFSNANLHVFYPAKSDGDWLLEEHKGAQALRQGRNCLQCHIGDAKTMGESLAPKGITPSIPINVNLKKNNGNMELTVKWKGSVNSNGIAIQFDNGKVEAFSREGCWASCHSDLPGMTRDRGQGLTKYLKISEKQDRVVGRQRMNLDQATLDSMYQQGNFVELWRVNLENGAFKDIKRYSILESRKEQALGQLSATAIYEQGYWIVKFIKPINDTVKPLYDDQVMTFGIAIHGDGESDAQHKVSLPLTLSFDGKDTNFVLK